MAETVAANTALKKRPNILLFLTDDESWLERSAYGWSVLPTPHFDRVAEAGALFTNGYTSAPSCAPSRACLLTGRHFWELKQGAFIHGHIPREFPIFSKILSDHGYKLGFTGKPWGPESSFHGLPKDSLGKAFNKAKMPRSVPHLSSTDYAANFEQFLKSRQSGEPFFFWAGTHEPHDGWDKKNYLRLEKEYGMTLDKVTLPPFLKDTPENRKERANFLYEICYADTHLGRMLKVLEQKGELNNTLVVVTSDNGTASPIDKCGKTMENDLRGKASRFDYGVHEPLAMMWPDRMKPGRTITDFVSFADLAPTFLEVAGLKPPAGMSGRSLLPLIESKKSGRIDPKRDFIMTGLEWHGEFDPVSRSSRMLREDRYAYVVLYNNVDDKGKPLGNIELAKPAKVEFYDMKDDPWQLKDLATDPHYRDEMKRLANRFQKYGMQTRDPRVTGEMDLFRMMRKHVQKRKRLGYNKTWNLPYEK